MKRIPVDRGKLSFVVTRVSTQATTRTTTAAAAVAAAACVAEL